MRELIFVLFIALAMSDCIGCFPNTKVDCTVDIDGAPKSETYPECYCKEPDPSGRKRPECEIYK